jgi:hypothetical protein
VSRRVPRRLATATGACTSGRVAREGETRVRVDEPGVDREAIALDHARVARDRDGSADGGDDAVAYDDGAALDRRTGHRDDLGISNRIYTRRIALSLNAELRVDR